MVGLLTFTVTACSASDSSDSTDSASSPNAATGTRTLTTAWPTDITSLDPANLSTGQDHELTRNIYQTLALPALIPGDGGQLNPQGE
jgi:ABC-type transport system substrate-binding protein